MWALGGVGRLQELGEPCRSPGVAHGGVGQSRDCCAIVLRFMDDNLGIQPWEVPGGAAFQVSSKGEGTLKDAGGV